MFTDANYPTLTVGIPTYNESSHIERVIRGFLATDYPNLIEVFIADGGSTDNTENIVKELSLEDSRVKFVHNHLKIQSAGLNIIIEKCKGEIFLRADAHSDYAHDYIEQSVETLIKTKALNAGGAQRFVAKNSFQAAVALASKSILGNGGARYRDPNYEGFVDTVYLGCFWRSTLLELSKTNTAYAELPVNEDFDLNLRLSKIVFNNIQVTNQDTDINPKSISRNPRAIYQSKKIKTWYYPRKTWNALLLQYFKYGRGRYLTSSKHPWISQIRGIIPFTVISLAVLMLVIDLSFPQLGLPIEILFLCGICLTFLDSFRLNWQFRKTFSAEIWRGDANAKPSFLILWFSCGVVLLTMPIAHCVGYAYQLIRHRFYRVEGW
ncbi:glycosyltransferase [Pseudanabaena sp. FACHB-1277]|uniref:Glycosyltransferase n=1 Tax=Pseudanabaena cinerea FACHB-1277 TaxID=2949581 RepID=A0A926UW49_9CYAN|nr:glycosyltransferase [Pseudanabaena cinerea]MBD2151105.1 glycosyltransferase [Pseudanabaena cinerea FACHB-1277]